MISGKLNMNWSTGLLTDRPTVRLTDSLTGWLSYVQLNLLRDIQFTALNRQVTYRCERRKRNALERIRFCEDQKATLRCPKGRKLDIQYANYGRLKGNVCGSVIFPKDCKEEDSLETVKADCEGKNECSLEANNRKFGDPCWGTKKYLEVSDVELKVPMKWNLFLFSIKIYLAKYAFPKFETSGIKKNDFTSLQSWAFCLPKMVRGMGRVNPKIPRRDVTLVPNFCLHNQSL